MSIPLRAHVPGEPSEPSPPQPSRVRELARIAVPIAILAAGLAGYAVLAAQREIPKREVPVALPPLVETIEVQAATEGLTLETDGMVVPYREVSLAAEVAGRIKTKSPNCRAGHFVTRGAPLLEIESRDYELEVQRLQRDFDQAGVLIEELDVEVQNNKELMALAEEDLELQRRELARVAQLAQTRVATESQLDDARRKELAARNAVTSVRNQLSLLGTRRSRLESARQLVTSQLEKARLELERTKITSPLDGVVVKEMVEQDAFVQKGTALVVIEDTSRVEVKCNLRMDELFWLLKDSPQAAQPLPVDQPGGGRNYELPRVPATIEYQLAGRKYTWHGMLDRYDGLGLDEQTRTVPCRVVVENPQDVTRGASDVRASGGPRALVRGMYVTVRLHARPKAGMVRLPELAVRPGDVVWRVVDGKLDIVSGIDIAEIIGDTVLADAGDSALEPGDRVIVSPLAVATPGMAVRERPQR